MKTLTNKEILDIESRLESEISITVDRETAEAFVRDRMTLAVKETAGDYFYNAAEDLEPVLDDLLDSLRATEKAKDKVILEANPMSASGLVVREA